MCQNERILCMRHSTEEIDKVYSQSGFRTEKKDMQNCIGGKKTANGEPQQSIGLL